MARITSASVRRLLMPLHTPYKLSYRTFHEFEPFVVEVQTDDGRTGFGDGHISPGSSSETREGGWDFAVRHLERLIGLGTEDAKECVLRDFTESKVATTAIVTAIEVLEDHPLLTITDNCALSLLTPTSASDRAGIEAEVEARLVEGYHCFKIKVGKDAEADLQRIGWYQSALGGRGTLRIDANRAYTRAAGEWFAARLDPTGVELFEQPCDADDWEANAAVAQVSTVPLMLDEPICTLADIARAADIPNVGFCKLKLKRFGGLERLSEGLAMMQRVGLEAIVGDGLGSDIQAWLEAVVTMRHTRLVGEYNGYLKLYDGVLGPPLNFERGRMQLSAGYRPNLDPVALERLTTAKAGFGSPIRITS